jgi:ABC-type multidrug transport system fused ATPase/permease subunit
MYAFAFYRFLPSANKILSEYNRINFCKHAVESVQTYLTYDLETLRTEKIEFKNQIELKNVSFSYDGKNKILDGANLVIQRGQRTAFVGESGAGKSTIVDILMGLYRPQNGDVFVDNIKLDKKNLKAWRGKIGYIPQQIYLFDGTVAENIVFGREHDENKIVAVLKKANIYDFLLKHEGLHKKVGEGGIQLSGGQKQRIAIARALYSDPEVLVLDEATSALDHETESRIMDEIYSLNADKTLIIVAHRLTTVERCENIYKIDNGKVVRVKDLSELTRKHEDVHQAQM